MPATALQTGVDDLTDPEQNIHGGTRYLAQQLGRYGGSVPLALAAFNAGPGAVDKYGGVPPYGETQKYVAQVQRRLAERKGMFGGRPDLLPSGPMTFGTADEVP